MSFDWATVVSAIMGAFVGGLITGFFAIKATTKSFEHQKQVADEEEKKVIKGLLQAIHDEMETINKRYHETMGDRLESLPEGKELRFYYPLFSEYFTVYNGNSFLIGRIPDNDLRKQIVKTYTMAKGMVDSFKMNNYLLEQYESAYKMHIETQRAVYNQQTKAYLKILVDYAMTLKDEHNKLKNEITTLLEGLKKWNSK